MESINRNEMFRKIQEINSNLESDCDIKYLEENMQFVLKVGEYYDQNRGSFDKNIREEVIYCYQFFSRYFLIYMAKKYNKNFKYNIMLNAEVEGAAFYSPKENSINILEKVVGHEDFEVIVFSIFHEFRHKMQWDDMLNSEVANLLYLDPAIIIFLKERIVLQDVKLYGNNHECFIMENDANLFALSEMNNIIKTDKVKSIFSSELSDYITAIVNGTDVSDQEYNDKQNLPIVYEQDYRFKKFISGKKVSAGSLLSLIYKADGTPKNYEELLKDKKQLIEKNKAKIIVKKTSTTNYQQCQQSSEKHIEEIYRLIIASDPMLTIQEYLYMANHVDNQFGVRIWVGKVKTLLENCPQLIDIYYREIFDILVSEAAKGKANMVLNIVENLPNEKLIQEISNIIRIMNQNTVSTSNLLSDAQVHEEHQIVTGQSSKSLYRPVISKSVIKSVMLREQKQELYKMKEQIELDQRQQNRETLIDEEEHGISM